MRVREQLVASHAYLAAHGAPETAEEVAAHAILRWCPAHERAATLPLRAGGRLAVEPVLESTDIHLLRRAAGAGLGIAYVPDAMLDPLLDTGAELVPVLRDVIGRERTLWMAIPAALAEIPRIRAVVDEADELVALARSMTAGGMPRSTTASATRKRPRKDTKR